MRYLLLGLLPLVITLALTSSGLRAQTKLRAWHTAGQTWLVWTDTSPSPDTYRIYASDKPITKLATAHQIGRIFAQEWQAERLKIASRGLNWQLPDGKGKSYRLTNSEAVFAYTPHAAKTEYFAVVKDGSSKLGSGNTSNGILQKLATPQAHIQWQGRVSGRAVRVYAHWIDGRKDWRSGRKGYPVMGNEHFNGSAHVFAVWEPLGGRKRPSPLVVALHGGSGSWLSFRPDNKTEIGLNVKDALVVTLDDAAYMRGRRGTARRYVTWWFGYWEDYDRFLSPDRNVIPKNGIAVDYSSRRLDWTVDWVSANEGIDANRVSMIGHSMGSQGADMNSRIHPERYAAVMCFSIGMQAPITASYLGRPTLDLKTMLPGAPSVERAWEPWTRLCASERDLPFRRFVIGKNDSNAWAQWSKQKVSAYEQTDAAHLGHQLYWDQRSHGTKTFKNGHWHGSPRLLAQDLLTQRRDRSFPAFFGDDHDLAKPGRQPQPGNGSPNNGEPWGTWGGYCDWDRSSISDLPGSWACSVFLISSSSFARDIPHFAKARVGIAIRRPQRFAVTANETCLWTLRRLSDNAILQRGHLLATRDGLVEIPGLVLSKQKLRLELQRSGLKVYGKAGKSCLGLPQLEPLAVAKSGNASFALRCSKAPPRSAGIVLIGAKAQLPPISLLGIDWHVALPGSIALPAVSNSKGESLMTAPLTSIASGTRAYLQFLWLTTASCGGPGSLAATAGYELQVR